MARLHLVFGGELRDLKSKEFKDPYKIDIIGIFPSEEEANNAWRAAAQKTVDSALTRYFVADLADLRKADD
ncbi:MAG: DUF4170 domain-containing protein [Pseudomonadota bacterium]